MIIGIALVVDELHKGQRLVYRYPESVPSSVLNSTEGLLKFHQDYQSLSPDNFAKLFRPKASLFNKILELTIDDLHYISFPCPCSDELSTDTSNQTATDVITLFNVVIATVRDSAMKKMESVANANSKRSNQQGSLFSKFDTAGSDPVAAALGLQSSAKAVCPNEMRRIVETISRALLNQEKRNRYVSKQVALMVRLQEDAIQRVSINQSVPNSSQHPNSSFNSVGNNLMNEINIVPKRNASTTLNPISENTASAKKKPSKQADLTQIASSAGTQISESTSRTSNPTSLNATPASKSSNAIELLSGVNHATVGGSAGGAYPGGVWNASPQRVASPPMASGEAGTIQVVLAVERDLSSNNAVVINSNNASAVLSQAVGIVAPSPHPNSGINPSTANAAAAAERSAVLRQPVFDKKLEVMESMQQQSSLANELRLIYHGLIGGHSVNLMINNSLAINMRLSKVTENLKVNLSSKAAREVIAARPDTATSRSGTENGFLTMLTIADSEEMLSLASSINAVSGPDSGLLSPRAVTHSTRRLTLSGNRDTNKSPSSGGSQFRNHLSAPLPNPYSGALSGLFPIYPVPSSSGVAAYSSSTPRMHPNLEELLVSMDPTVSLEELGAQLEQPLREIFRMCHHLEGWGLGFFTPTISSDRKYKVKPNAPSNATLKVARTFNSVFQEPLKETVKFLEFEIERLEDEEELQENAIFNHSSDAMRQKTAKDKLNAPEDFEYTENYLKISTGYNSRYSAALPVSSSPSSTVKMPPAVNKSLFNFSHLNNPSQSRNTAGTGNNNHIDNTLDYSNQKNKKGDGIHTQDAEVTNKILKRGSLLNLSALKTDEKTTPKVPTRNIQELANDKKKHKISVEYTLPCVLAVFDGNHSLDQAIRKLPPPLQPFGVDIVVWLLRWKMIEEVSTYVLSLAELDRIHPKKVLDQEALEKDNRKSRNLEEFSKILKPLTSLNCETDQYEKKKNVVPTAQPDSRGNNYTINLTEYEQNILSRLSPYFDGVLPLHEIAWRERLSEEDILKLVKKNPNVLVFHC